MAEQMSAEAKALELAHELAKNAFSFAGAGRKVGEPPPPGRFWENLDTGNPEEIKARLREYADLIGDLRSRMLR